MVQYGPVMQRFLQKNKSLFVVLWPYLWYGVMLIAPLATIVALSFSEFSTGAPPYRPLFRPLSSESFELVIHLTNYLIVFKDSFYRAAFMNSLGIATMSTLFCLIIGYPMAYGIARSKHHTVWLLLAILPFFTSFLVRIYAWMTLLSPQGLINHGLEYLGLQPWSLMNTPYAIIIGVVYSYLPFMIFPLYGVFDKMSPNILEAAHDLGCRPFWAFWRITVPLSRSGISAGSSLVFIPAVGEYLIPELLGGPTSLTIGRLLWSEFFINRDWPLASTLAVCIIVALFLPMFLFKKLQTLRRQPS
jgi:putrescine transport system permease protein